MRVHLFQQIFNSDHSMDLATVYNFFYGIQYCENTVSYDLSDYFIAKVISEFLTLKKIRLLVI